MKTIQRLIVLAVLVAGIASVALAGPGPQFWNTLRTEAQFKDLKSGGKIAHVCNQCQSVNEKTITSMADAVDFLHRGLDHNVSFVQRQGEGRDQRRAKEPNKFAGDLLCERKGRGVLLHREGGG